MKPTGFYPLMLSDDVAAAKRFYVEHLGMEATFDANWYVQLQHPADRRIEFAFIARDHDSIPPHARTGRGGTVLSFEAEDVDGAYEQAQLAGLPILLTLRDEVFGQRHFITADPDGNLIDMIKFIAPSPEFLANPNG